MSGSDELSVRGKAVKIGLVVVLLGAAGFIAYSRTGSDKIEQLDTAESAMPYVCVECGHGVDLTAAQYADMITKNQTSRSAVGELRGYSFLLCPKCQKPAMVMGAKCPKDGSYIPQQTKDGKRGNCKKCGSSLIGSDRG